jgi:formylglycine-generating enzyme required for sulfatase activity
MSVAHSHFESALFMEPSLVTIPAAWFLMGSASGQDCERPVHRVWVDAFLLAATQVTNAEYECFLRSTGAQPPPFWSDKNFSDTNLNDKNFSDPGQPVTGASWFEAERYCEWLSSLSGRGYRLPSEAEWERAARGDLEQQDYPWGNEAPQTLPDYATRWLTGPEAVARYAANAFGLHNICDNVHEWCGDWYDANYYATSPERNPRGPEQGQRRASRGGSWRHHVKVSRCSARSSIPPEFQYADYGFRVACKI